MRLALCVDFATCAETMRAQRLWFILVTAGMVVLAPGTPGASERSELLVAQGEVAYHRGRYEDARSRFAEAVAADPADATAHYRLGLALLALGRRDEAEARLERAVALRPDYEAARRALALERGEETPTAEVTRPGTPSAPTRTRKRWEIHAATGVQYDSNVTIAPGGLTGEQFGDRDDVGFVLTGGGRYDVIDRSDALVRLEYDLYQTLHVSLTDFDFRAHHIRGTASHALIPSLLWGGVQGGYHHYTLGPHSYLSQPTVMPFLSLLEGGWGLTQLSYRFGYDTYLSTAFHEVRDGPSHAVGLDQTLYELAGTSYVAAGYQWGTEDPIRTSGNDYELQFHQAYAGVGIPVGWKVALDLMYLYRYDDYTHPNSFVDFRKARHDSTHYFYASVSRPIIPHVSVAIAYFGTIDYSNISLYEYHRNVVSAVLEVTY
jgi:tetratricopeptide (TPR) repeat protein